MFKKFFVLIILIFLITLFIPSLVMGQNNQEVPFDELKTPTELQDVIDTFASLKYNFKAFDEGEKAQELMIEFQYQGKESVQGVEVDKIFIETSTMKTSAPTQLTFWMDDGEIVKMKQDEQEIPAEMADSMNDKMLQTVFFPFYHFEELPLEEIAANGRITEGQEMIGDKNVDVIKIEGDDLAEYGFESGSAKVADFEKFMMTVNFEYTLLEQNEGQYDEGKFEVKEIKLR